MMMTLKKIGAVVAGGHGWILAVGAHGGRVEVSRNNDKVWVGGSSFATVDRLPGPSRRSTSHPFSSDWCTLRLVIDHAAETKATITVRPFCHAWLVDDRSDT